MARKSRDYIKTERPRFKVWRIGIYIRLSKEDGRHLDESESITNQRSIIEAHIAKFDDGDEYIIVDEYVDDGISGTTDDERAGFQRMLIDIQRGRINCVIVKDLARSFRNYSDQGYYLDDWFPRYNVRFISLFHQPLDSYKEPKNMRSIIVPIQGVLNENHCAETSEKIREVFDVKRRNGEHIGSFAAYGWIKDPNNKNALLLDEEAAAVINEIGDMLLNGYSLNGVAVYLNEHGILCPTAYKREKLGLKYTNSRAIPGKRPLWCAAVIRRMMTDRMLAGDLIQGRYRVKSYKVHIQERVPEEEWYIVENAIPAVMDRDKFDRIQNVLKRETRTAPQEKKLYLFSGFLRCADCGKAMCRSKVGKSVYYYCRTYKSQSKTACTKHTIRHDLLENAVLASIQEQIYLAVDYDELMQSVSQTPAAKNKAKRIHDAIEHKENELSKISHYKKVLYQDWKDGELNQKEYRAMKADYDEQEQELEFVLKKLIEEQKNLESEEEKEPDCLAAFKRYQNIEKLSRDVIIELVDQITIHEGGKISIRFRFSDELEQLHRNLKNNTKTAAI